MAPTWEELAQKLKAEGHTASVAAVDATKHRALGTRFGVKGFPTLILFADGHMYKYKGARSVDDLAGFVKGGYKQAPAEPTPAAPSMAQQVKDSLVELFNAIVVLFQTQFAAALVMTAIAFFTGLTVGFAGGLILAPNPTPQPRPDATPRPRPQAPAINEGDKKDQ